MSENSGMTPVCAKKDHFIIGKLMMILRCRRVL